jgi:hypothetical protein
MQVPAASPTHRLGSYLADGLLILVILALSLKLTHGIASVRDLGIGDEASYMQAGSRIPEHGLPEAQASPLYSLWYYGLSLLQPDRVQLYYLSWRLLTFLLAASLFVLLRCLGATRALALLAAFLLLTSQFVDIWPYPSHLATVLLALGAALAVRLRSGPWSLAVLGITLLLATYIRPELTVACLLFGVVGLAAVAWVLLRRANRWHQLLGPVLLVGLAVFGLVQGIGNPLAGGRSFAAFIQQFGRNYASAYGFDGDPCVHWETVAREHFGSAQTLAEAWRANPHAVLWNCSVNARRIPLVFVDCLTPNLQLRPVTQRWVYLLLLLAGGLGLVGLVNRLRQRGEAVDRRGSLLVLLLFGLLLVPVTASALIIRPNPHYFMPIAFLSCALVGPGLGHVPGLPSLGTRLESRWGLTLLAVVLLSVTPNRAHRWSAQELLTRPFPPAPRLLPSQQTVAALRALHLQKPIVVLDYVGNAHTFYAGLSADAPNVATKTEGFWQFVRRHHVNVIVLSPHLILDPSCRNDPEFKEFVAGKRLEDFELFSVPNLPAQFVMQIAVRSDALPAEWRGRGQHSTAPGGLLSDSNRSAPASRN